MWKTISYTSLVSSRAQTCLNLAKTSHRIIACNLSISTNRSLLINIPKFSGTTTTLLSHQIRRTNGSASQQPDLKTPLNNAKSTNTTTQAPKKRDFIRFLAIFASGVIAYFAISYSLDARSNAHKTDAHINYSSPNLPGKIKPSKSIIREKNPGGIKITLYQYVTCPFCCKVRAYLDYYGYSYDIVEVNSINKKQIDWSSYKKVPILAVQTPSAEEPDKYNDTIMQLNDSTVIISSLETYRLGPNKPLNEITTYYEPLEIEGEKGRRDYINKYFVMLYNQAMNDNKDVSERRAERDWREWVDKKFIHAISPNVYRTMSESLEAFDWFKVAGDWEKQFNTFELISIHYIGAIVMYIIGKRLKKKHELKDDVRQSMYEYCNEWVESLNGKFKGGNRPNLADLALYGAIGSFKGCTTFDDIMNNSKIRSWYEACREEVENSQGKDLLHQTSGKNRPFTSSYPETTKKSKRFGIF